MAGFNLDNYVPVEDRIEAFYEKHPEGSIQTELAHFDPQMVIVKATIYRHPDDPRPSTGHSQMNIPGKTSFTKDSETENAETSAVGRALAMMGFEVRKGVASRQEVRNKAPMPDPQIDTPAWVDPFNKERKAKGITATEIATVIGASGTISNIEKWMTEGNFTTTDLLQFASDLKGLPVG